MATLNDIYKLRSALEESVRAAFVAQEFKAFTRLNAPQDFQKDRPRVEIKASIGPATGRRHVCPDRIIRFDAWSFTLALQAITAPSASEGDNVLHEDYVARVRAYCSYLGGQPSFDDVASFPNHYIADPVRDAGGADTLQTEAGVEHSVLSYTGTICVRPSAWAGSTTETVVGGVNYRIQLKDPATNLWLTVGVNGQQINLDGSNCRFSIERGIELLDPADGEWKKLQANDGQLQLDPP